MILAAVSTTQIAIVIAVAVMLAAGIAIWFFARKRRTESLRTRFGAEYDRVVEEGGSQRQAEAVLHQRAERVDALHIQPLTFGDRARFVESWGRIQSRFVDNPPGAVTDADKLLGEVMSARGYPVSDFEQRAADISVDHPLVLENYRAAHRVALLQAQAQASTEDLRQAMIHYRTLFDDLVSESGAAPKAEAPKAETPKAA